MTRDEAQKIVGAFARDTRKNTILALHALCVLAETPAEAPEGEPMPCVCGGEAYVPSALEGLSVSCEKCRSSTAWMPTHDDAIRVWNAMQREARK